MSSANTLGSIPEFGFAGMAGRVRRAVSSRALSSRAVSSHVQTLMQRAGAAPAHSKLSLPTMELDADESLMLRYAAGDQAAFAHLYGRYKNRIFRFQLRLVRQPAVAEELSQETWMRVIHAAGRYQASAAFKSYLFQIAHRLALDWLRRERGNVQVDQDVLSVLPDLKPGPELQLEGAEGKARLYAAIDQLPDLQRAALLLQAEADLSLDEIATLMQTGRETVKSRLRYAFAKLREALR